jgi:hypothetical protein
MAGDNQWIRGLFSGMWKYLPTALETEEFNMLWDLVKLHFKPGPKATWHYNLDDHNCHAAIISNPVQRDVCSMMNFVITVYSRLSRLMEGEGMHGWLRNMANPNFIFYTLTAPLARHRLRNLLFSHTSHSVCSRVQGDKSHRDVPLLWTKYSVYIFIVHNFMNKILGKLKKESWMNNTQA